MKKKLFLVVALVCLLLTVGCSSKKNEDIRSYLESTVLKELNFKYVETVDVRYVNDLLPHTNNEYIYTDKDSNLYMLTITSKLVENPDENGKKYTQYVAHISKVTKDTSKGKVLEDGESSDIIYTYSSDNTKRSDDIYEFVSEYKKYTIDKTDDGFAIQE